MAISDSERSADADVLVLDVRGQFQNDIYEGGHTQKF